MQKTSIHIFYSIYMKCPEKTNVQRQKAAKWLAGTRLGGGLTANMLGRNWGGLMKMF